MSFVLKRYLVVNIPRRTSPPNVSVFETKLKTTNIKHVVVLEGKSGIIKP